jgi:hypothetical protein
VRGAAPARRGAALAAAWYNDAACRGVLSLGASPPMEHTPPRLRPLALGDLLDGVFRIYRSNFLTLIAIVAVLQVPLLVAQILLDTLLGARSIQSLQDLTEALARFDPRLDSFNDLPLGAVVPYFAITFGIALVQGLLVQQLVQGALAAAVADTYLGRPVTVGGAYGKVLPRLPALIGAGLLLGLLAFAVIGVAVGLVAGLAVAVVAASGGGGVSPGGAVAASVALALLFIVVVFAVAIATALVLVRFAFFVQAVVVEGRGPVDALRRSWRLVRGSYWRVLGIMLLLLLLLYILIGVPTGIAGVVIQLVFPDPVRHFAMRQSLSTLVGYLSQIVVLPLQLVAYTLLYYDLRVRKEGYDIELLAAGQV